MYVQKIDNYSSKELEKIFTKHIDKRVRVTIDLWKSYCSLFKDYDITQIESDGEFNFKALYSNTSSEILNQNNLFLGK